MKSKPNMPFAVAKGLLSTAHQDETSEGWWSRSEEWFYEVEWFRRGREVAFGLFEGDAGTVMVYATKKYATTHFQGRHAKELKQCSKTREYHHDEPPEVHDGGMGFW